MNAGIANLQSRPTAASRLVRARHCQQMALSVQYSKSPVAFICFSSMRVFKKKYACYASNEFMSFLFVVIRLGGLMDYDTWKWLGSIFVAFGLWSREGYVYQHSRTLQQHVLQ